MRAEDIEVTLAPHLGHQATRLGVIEIDLGQWLVFANGRHVGYVDKRPGFGVKLIAFGLPEVVQQTIKRKVDELLGRETPQIHESAPIIAVEDDDDDGYYGYDPDEV